VIPEGPQDSEVPISLPPAQTGGQVRFASSAPRHQSQAWQRPSDHQSV